LQTIASITSIILP